MPRGLFVTIGASAYFEKSKLRLALTAIRNDETSARGRTASTSSSTCSSPSS
ncbi:MAG: hypothetical protein H7A27_00685 [Spirochaetaceae bacterium]|nr:hypothetical protein [Spirochaetaceae bacterium]